MLEKTLENPLDCKEIKSVNPKGNQSWTFIGMTDAEAEAPILWPPDGKNWLIGKDPDVGKDGRQEEKGMTEDRIVGWHHWLDEHEFEQASAVVMDREAWRTAVHEVTKSQTWLSDWTEMKELEIHPNTFITLGFFHHMTKLTYKACIVVHKRISLILRRILIKM